MGELDNILMFDPGRAVKKPSPSEESNQGWQSGGNGSEDDIINEILSKAPAAPERRVPK